MNSSAFICKHLGNKPGTEAGICAVCGTFDIKAHLKKYILSANFNDIQYLKYNSNYICSCCAKCLSDSAIDGKPLRSYSIFVTESNLIKLAHDDIHKIFLTPLEIPCLIMITYSHKKHIFFHAQITNDINAICVATDVGNIIFSQDEFIKIFNICNELYNKVGLSKDNIRFGQVRWKQVEEYGINTYQKLEYNLQKYYHTGLLNFIIYCLVKEKAND